MRAFVRACERAYGCVKGVWSDVSISIGLYSQQRTHRAFTFSLSSLSFWITQVIILVREGLPERESVCVHARMLLCVRVFADERVCLHARVLELSCLSFLLPSWCLPFPPLPSRPLALSPSRHEFSISHLCRQPCSSTVNEKTSPLTWKRWRLNTRRSLRLRTRHSPSKTSSRPETFELLSS